MLNLVRDFSAFSPDNCPYGEHDFGSVEYCGTRYFWKIDYYDLQMAMHSPAVTVRVLTVMRADEYQLTGPSEPPSGAVFVTGTYRRDPAGYPSHHKNTETQKQ